MKTETIFGDKTFFLTDDGTYRYTWTAGMPKGTKISTAYQKQLEQQSGVQKILGEYMCEETEIPSETFKAPEGISFIDVGQ